MYPNRVKGIESITLHTKALVSPSFSPRSLFMLIDCPNSVVSSLLSLWRAHILWLAAETTYREVRSSTVFYPGKQTWPWRFHSPRALSWAHAAREAARRGTMLLLEVRLSRKSKRQVTRSMDGQERTQRSERRSLGPVKKSWKCPCVLSWGHLPWINSQTQLPAGTQWRIRPQPCLSHLYKPTFLLVGCLYWLLYWGLNLGLVHALQAFYHWVSISNPEPCSSKWHATVNQKH